MRIALVSPLMEAVPPRTYGGTERVVETLANTLSSWGHSVTVYATEDSRVNAELVGCRDRPMLTDKREHVFAPDHILMLNKVRQQQHRFDVIHFHTEFLHFPIFQDIADKTLTTCHSRLDLVNLPKFFDAYRQFPLVSISDSQRKPMPMANWYGTIYHGYPLDQYRAIPGERGDRKGEYLAFLGRIAPEKGIADAIDIARSSGMRLKIAARINTPDRSYWEECIEPQIDGEQIVYVGEVNDCEKSEFLSRASALLFPINWPEPFGLVLIEAMACGTPTVAYRRGSVPEVIDDGKTGTIVENVSQAVDALDDLGRFERRTIRNTFERRFSAREMVSKYIDIYHRLASGRLDRKMSAAKSSAIKKLAQASTSEASGRSAATLNKKALGTSARQGKKPGGTGVDRQPS